MVIIGKSNERKIIGDSIRSIESDIHKLKLLKNKLFNKLMKDNDQLDVDTLYAKLKTFNSTDHPRPVRKNNGLRLSREKLAFYTYDFWGNDVIIMVPGFLILMAAFALFSAVFLTLLFDSKPVTEPL